MKVIDVSEHNGAIDYEKVKADGVDGVVIRAGYGKGNVDKRFTANITGAMKAGLHIGIYWFSYAFNEAMAKNEARYMDEIVQPYRPYLDMPVFFDWEYESMKFAKKNGVNPDKSLITDMTKVFCEEIKSLGYVAGYYLNLDYSKNYYDESELTDYKRWFARYVKTDQKDCYLWQKTSGGSVDGINGKVDIDVLWGDLTDYEWDGDISSFNEPEGQEKVSSTVIEQENESPYIVGNTYTIKVRSALNVRTGAGKQYSLVGYAKLTADGKKNALKNGALKNGTRVTVQAVVVNSSTDIWVKIPSGWICAVDGNKKYLV